MEEFFSYHQSPEPILYFEPELNFPVLKASAFKNYTENVNFRNKSLIGVHKNMNKRVIEFLGRDFSGSKEVEKDRCYKHMICERKRRERQKQGYLALLALLPPRTKNDKKTIVQVASNEIKVLQNKLEILEKRKIEIEAILAARDELNLKTETANIRFRVSNPSSGIESMLEVLKCLKNVGSTARAIHATFSEQELLANLEIRPKVEAAQVEKYVERTLLEVEKKHPFLFPT